MSKHKKQESEERVDGQEAAASGAPEGAEPVPENGSADAAQARLRASEEALAAAEKAAAGSEAKIAALEAEVSSLKDQYLRKLADYENFRKRMFREKDDAVKYANSQILGDLVTVIDDFDRAVHSSEHSKDFASLHDGVDMIRKGLLGLLETKYGLERFESLGTAFDPNVHEAVMSEQGECAEPVVVEEFVKGYKLRDRVIRSAKVKVRLPSPAGRADERTTEDTKE